MPVETAKTAADKTTAAAARASYYAGAKSWAEDRQEFLARSRRTAWILAGVAAGVAALEAVALAALAPLKTVVPYTVLVDRTTGYAQVLQGDRPPAIAPQAALTQSLLAQYVVARETFDMNSLREQYRKVALWSADGARADYLAKMSVGNPASPLNQYARTTVVTTRIESVSPIGPQTAMVRFVTDRADSTVGGAQRAYWVAVLKYRFSGEPMALEDRLLNPLGFQVVQYRRDPEAPPPAPSRPADAVAPPSPGAGGAARGRPLAQVARPRSAGALG